MPKKRKSDTRLEKEREGGHKRLQEKIIKREEKKLEEGMIAREDALKNAGIKQEYNYADHQHIYNSAGDRDVAPIETIGNKIVKCKKCSYLKDGNLPKQEQCRCNWTARGWQSPPPSPPRSPNLSRNTKPSLTLASPCPAKQESVPVHLVEDGARRKRAMRFLDAVTAAAERR
jgi:hypothetical protein